MVEVIEIQLERLACFVLGHPKLSLAVCLLTVFVLTLGMSRMYIDVTNESMFHEADSTLTQFRAFQSQYGRDDAALAAIDSPDLFTPQFLEKLRAYHQDLEANVPYLDRVTSLVNITSVTDDDGEILIDQLQALWPKDTNSLASFKRSIIDNELYRNLVVSAEGEVTLLLIRANVFATQQESANSFKSKLTMWHDNIIAHFSSRTQNQTSQQEDSFFSEIDLQEKPVAQINPQPLTTPQLQEFIQSIKEVTTQHQTDEFIVKLAGGAVIADEHAATIHLDFAKLLPFIFFLVFLLLFILLRRLAAVFIPLLVVTLTLLATLGFMGWIGSPVTPVIVALPPLLLTIGVADSVHILSSFYNQYNISNNKQEAIVYSVKRIGIAVLFTSLTTIGGFLAFIIADLKPIADFGLLVAFGVAVALLLSLIVIPAILVLSNSSVNQKQPTVWLVFFKPMLKLTKLSTQYSGRILVVVTILIACSIPGIMKLNFSHNTLQWFAEDNSVRVNTLWMDKIFSGTIPFELIIDTEKENGLYDPIIMQKLESFQQYAESLDTSTLALSHLSASEIVTTTMGRSTSIVDTLKRIHWVLNQESPSSSIPLRHDLVAQELLLFETSGADDVSELIDSQFSKARLTVRMSWTDAIDYLPIRQQLLAKAEEIFSPRAKVYGTGTIDLISRVVVSVIQSMITSYLMASIVIGLMLILLMRSISLGLVSMIPNFLPIIFSLAIMGYAGLPIDMFTVLLGGIALGIVVDDTVHFMHAYRYHRYTLGMTLEESIEQVVSNIGPALLFTTIAVATGFFVLLFSSLSALSLFGLIISLTIINALVIDLLVTPAAIKITESLGIFIAKPESTQASHS